MLNHALLVNKTELRFTELEFYYFEEKVHEDYFTHEHQCGECEWRFHNQGLDITFGHTDKSDGGILIRGVSYVDHGKTICVNGPRRVVATIFSLLGKCDQPGSISIRALNSLQSEIYKTTRHLPNTKDYFKKEGDFETFKNKPYRFVTSEAMKEIGGNLKFVKL